MTWAFAFKLKCSGVTYVLTTIQKKKKMFGINLKDNYQRFMEKVVSCFHTRQKLGPNPIIKLNLRKNYISNDCLYSISML